MARDTVVTLLQDKGWTKEQALGLAANFEAESNFNPAAVGDGGKAYGIAQWHPDRQAEFQKKFGKAIQGSTLEEQVAFVDYELREGNERRAGGILSGITNAQEAARAVTRYYERPLHVDKDSEKRAGIVAGWLGEATAAALPTAKATATPGTSLASQRQQVDPTYPVLPTARANQQRVSEGLMDGAALASLDAGMGQTAKMMAGNSGTSYDSAQYDKLVTEQNQRNNTTVGDLWDTYQTDPRVMSQLALADHLTRDPEVVPEGWSYYDNVEAIEGAWRHNQDYVDYLRENVRGPESMQRAHAQLLMRQDADQLYSRRGGLANFAVGGVSSMTDIPGLLAGLGVAKGFQIAKMGHVSLAARGKRLAAGGAFLGEAAVGNVAVEALLDSLGEVKSAGDYAMAAATGAAMATPFLRGAMNHPLAKANTELERLMGELKDAEVADQVAKASTIMADPTVTPQQAAARMEAETIRQVEEIITQAMTSKANQKLFPEDVEAEVRSGKFEEAPVPVAPEATPVAPEPVAPVVAPQPVTPVPQTRVMTTEVGYDAKLPKDLAGAKTNYSYGSKKFTVEFLHDVERAAYVVTGKGRSKRHAEYEAFLEQAGFTPESIQNLGQVIRDRIKAEAATSTEPVIRVGGERVPDGPAPTVAQPAAKVEVEQPVQRELPDSPTTKDMLESIRDETYYNRDEPGTAAAAADYLLKVAPEGTFDVPMKLVEPGTRESFTPSTNTVAVSPTTKDWIAVHEAVHQAVAAKIEPLLKEGAEGLSPAVKKAVLRLNDLMEQVKKHAEGLELSNRVGYGLTNIQEFAAQALSDPQFQQFLNTVQVTGRSRGLSTAWAEFIRTLAQALGFKAKPGFALRESLQALDQILQAPAMKAQTEAALFAPSMPPHAIQAAERRWIQRIKENAAATMAANPINKERTDVLMRKVSGDMVSDGLRLATHDSPLLQLVSRIVTETTTGAAGRGNTAAVALPQIQGQIMRNFLPDIQGTFDVWAAANGHGKVSRLLKSDAMDKFNTAVFSEIHAQRSSNGQPVSADQAVVKAASIVRDAMERANKLQVAEMVAGSENLPHNSIGYIPQSLSGAKLSDMAIKNPAAVIAFKKKLVEQFKNAYGWDEEFSVRLVERYVERQMERSKGPAQADAMAQGGDDTGVLREVLEDMSTGGSNGIDYIALSQAKGLAQKDLKSRLNVNMFEELGVDGLRVMDFYNQDIQGMVRSYAHRTAGTVAITRHGIPGSRGVSLLRKAVVSEANVTADDLKVFDRVMSGILGTPYSGRVVSQGAANLGALVNLQRMGSLVWNQLMEPINMIHHLGLRSLLSGLPDLARHISDVGRMAKDGDAQGSGMLRFIESYGGSDIGLDSYRNVAPLDPNNAALDAYMDNPGLITRLLRGGGHLQSKVTGFRRLIAAQHRMVAEQIMLKALKYIRDPNAKHDVYLADMGFTSNMVESFRAELPGIASWDSHGGLVDFDLTRHSDQGYAQAFVNAVHRGTSQIIQNTYVGERNAWAHNDYLRLMTQFRTYGLTAMEKQWARSRMNSGFAGAAGMLAGQVLAGAVMHAARVHTMSIGREDREEFVEKSMSMSRVITSAMTYSTLSGVMTDVVEGAMFLAGGASEDLREAMGRTSAGSSTTGSLIPVAGSVESAMRILSGKGDVYTALKQLPGSNIWWIAPLINITKD